jgi:hypothetical protein
MRERGWIPIGGIYCTESMQESLDKHLKAFLQRAISVWVAVVLEKAGVITIDRMLNAYQDTPGDGRRRQAQNNPICVLQLMIAEDAPAAYIGGYLKSILAKPWWGRGFAS